MRGKIVGVALIGLALAAAGQRSRGEDATPSGAEVFRLNCMACHGEGAAGTALAPRINDVFARLKEPEVRQVLREGRNTMPVFAHLPPADLDAVLDYLKEPKAGAERAPVASPDPASPQRAAATPVDVALGERVVRSNCLSCHTTAPERRSRGPASFVNVTKRFTDGQIANLMRNGVCVMPSFAHLTARETGSVIAFLKTLESDDAPRSLGGCGSCGMVARAANAGPGEATPPRCVPKQPGAKACGGKAATEAGAGCGMGCGPDRAAPPAPSTGRGGCEGAVCGPGQGCNAPQTPRRASAPRRSGVGE